MATRSLWLDSKKLSERNCGVALLAFYLEFKEFDYNFRFQTNGHSIVTDTNAEKQDFFVLVSICF